jgi:hypothetical protein
MKGRNKPRPPYVATMTDDVWASSTLAERALHVARSQERLKVQEVPRGSNTGPMVRLYLRAAGLVSPAAWCAAFLTWCLIEAGADKKKLPRFSASTYYWFEWAKSTNRLSSFPKRGSFGVGNSGNGHIFVVSSRVGDLIYTIEGNSNSDGSREGYAVVNNTRSAAAWLRTWKRAGFITIGDDLYEN